MARLCLPLHLVFAVSFLIHALHSHAFPTEPANQNSLVMLNSSINAITPHCYTPDSPETPGIEPVDLQSCRNALLVLVRSPHFTTSYRFSRNPRAQARSIPLGWQLGLDADCRIIINCHNDRDTGVFRLADIAQAARKIIDDCVYKPDPDGRLPLFKWGGVRGLVGQETFYVAVAKPIRSLRGVGAANGTVFTGEGLLDGVTEVL